ncbi:uncharacterized protein [Littorina saxatilis]|uniref:uncharacterized protein isoform X2 n=1 Tax=Littorina saxatilis TaxID=31220 RepID=UPI0038B5004B
MESVAVILTTVAAILSLTAWADDDGDNEEVYSNVTCDFSDNNFCGWKNQRLETNSNLTWTIGHYALENNSYARLDVSNLSYPRPVTGELASPWLNKEKTGYNCTLEFVYFIRLSGTCKLFLYQQMSSGLEDLLETDYGTGKIFSDPTWVNVNCTAEKYRLVFRGVHKNTNFPCSNHDDNEIAIDDIVYHVGPGTSTRKGPNVDSGRVVLGPGSLAAIIIAALAVVIAIICAIVCVVKQNNRQQTHKPGLHILLQRNSRSPGSGSGTSLALTNTSFRPEQAAANNPARSSESTEMYLTPENTRGGLINQNNGEIPDDSLTTQTNKYEPLSHGTDENRPYETLTNQRNIYETPTNDNRDDKPYDTLFASTRDSDGYELPVAKTALGKPRKQNDANHVYNN